jgi:hypothetical protein
MACYPVEVLPMDDLNKTADFLINSQLRAMTVFLWRGWGLNPRPEDYDAPALLAELPRHS